jgi:hypothetical protein
MYQNMERVDIVEEGYFMVDSCRGFRRYGMHNAGDQNIGFLNVIITPRNKA